MNLGLTGRVKPSIVNNGVVTWEGEWTRNLWLDAGLNRIADIPICDCFSIAAKGTGTLFTSSDQSGTANTFSVALNSTTLNRTAGTFDFNSLDVGTLLRFSTTPFQEFTITAINSGTSVEVTPPASPAVVNKKIIVYFVQHVKLAAEVGRTREYSNTPNENKTVTVGNARTFTRTFLFPTEDTLVEYVAATNTYSQSGTIVTRVTGARDFTSGDVGAKIHFIDSNTTATIQSVSNVSHVVVDLSESNAAQTVSITQQNAALRETPATSNTYSRAGAVVTRVAGARNFGPLDVGKIIHFNADNSEAKITVYTDVTHVTVDVSGTLAAQTIKLYGFTDYTEIGFSDSMQRADNINIRVLLGAPVRTYVATALRASDQLKLAYEVKLTVTPNTAVAGSLASIISDPGNQMSGNKNGKSTIESFATSTVFTTGETDISFADLEPFYEGFAALSLSGAAAADVLAPLTNKVRENSTAYVPMVADPYVPQTFFKTFQAVFGLNDAINNNWRTVMIYDPDSKCAIYTFLYDTPQKKDGEHTFQVSFKKSWNRDLS